MGQIENKEIWNTNVTELFKIFKESVIVIIPSVEKAKIKWKDGDAYDDWDNIVEVLYKNIVCSTLYGDVLEEYPLPEYGKGFSHYNMKDRVLVRSDLHKDKILVFISCLSINNPFDFIRVAVINNSYETVEFLEMEINNLEFTFIKHDDNKEIVISKISVLI